MRTSIILVIVLTIISIYLLSAIKLANNIDTKVAEYLTIIEEIKR